VQRIEFPQKVKDRIRLETGPFCSKPSCRRYLSFYSIPDAKLASLAQVAHIYAASVGGPRTNPFLSEHELKSPDNALQLCSVCHALVDACPQLFPAETLQEWKRKAKEDNTPESLHQWHWAGENRTLVEDCEQVQCFLNDRKESYRCLENFLRRLQTASILNPTEKTDLSAHAALLAYSRNDSAQKYKVVSRKYREKAKEIIEAAGKLQNTCSLSTDIVKGHHRVGDTPPLFAGFPAGELCYDDKNAQAIHLLLKLIDDLQACCEEDEKEHYLQFSD